MGHVKGMGTDLLAAHHLQFDRYVPQQFTPLYASVSSVCMGDLFLPLS